MPLLQIFMMMSKSILEWKLAVSLPKKTYWFRVTKCTGFFQTTAETHVWWFVEIMTFIKIHCCLVKMKIYFILRFKIYQEDFIVSWWKFHSSDNIIFHQLLLSFQSIEDAKKVNLWHINPPSQLTLLNGKHKTINLKPTEKKTAQIIYILKYIHVNIV